MRVTVSIDIMPRHIQLAAVILAGISILILGGSNTLPILRTPQGALPLVIGPLVGPATEFAQFIAIGPENRVPQRHRAYGIAAYVAFVAACNTAVARYYSSPNVKAMVQGLCSALRGEAPVPDFMSLDEQDMDDVLALVLTAFMSASLSVFTLALGLDLVGPWSGLRTFHFTSAIAFLIMPAIKYTDVRTWAEATLQGENLQFVLVGLIWWVASSLVTTVRNRRKLARRMIAHRQLAQQLGIDGSVGSQSEWGQNAHADAAHDAADEGSEAHLSKSVLAFSLTLALYGPLLKAFDLPAGSPVFGLSSVI